MMSCRDKRGSISQADRRMSRNAARSKNLRVEFPTRRGTLVAVDDVSFAIGRGEVLGVVGESGAGKSLTGMAIIGLLEPPGRIAAGEIRLDGERIDDLPAERMRRTARATHRGDLPGSADFAQSAVYHRTADDRDDPRPSAGVRQEARERAVALLVEVGIPAPEQRIDQYPHQFSVACASAW